MPIKKNLGVLNVMDFGAKGDGVTDDTAAIQKAVDDTSAKKASLFFPEGVYIVSSTINVSKGVLIYGDNAELRVSQNGLAIILKATAANNLKIRGIQFNANLKGRTSIDVMNTTGLEISSCSFTGYSKEFSYQNTDSGIRLTDCYDVLVKENSWKNHGFQYTSATADLNRCLTIQGLSDRVTVDSNLFYKVNQAIVIAAGEGHVVSNNSFWEVQDNSLYILQDVKGVTISGNLFNERYDESIVFSGENITITGNTFKNVPNKVFAVNGNTKNLTIVGNTIANELGVSIANVLAYRDASYVITGFVFSGNNIRVETNVNSSDFFQIDGEMSGFVISNNVINVVTQPYHKVFRFRGVANGTISNNRIICSDSTALAFDAYGTASGSVLVEKNDLVTCRFTATTTPFVAKGYAVSTAVGPYATAISSTREVSGTAVPAVGAWAKGDVILNSNPSDGGTQGWICVTSGTPGTWKALGVIGSSKLTSQTDSVATDVAGLKADFNALLGKLRTAGLM